MKITHVLYLSEQQGQRPFSGAENHLWMLLPALARAGEDVELLVVLWRGDSFEQVKRCLNDLNLKGVKVTVIERGSQESRLRDITSKISAWLTLWRHLLKRRNRIVHLHLEMVYTPFITWVAGCRKVICTIHNDEPIFGAKTWRVRLQMLNRVISRYIAITHQVRSYYTKVSGAPAAQVTTVYYGVDLPNTLPYTRQEFGIPDDAFVVGFVGRLTQQKNLIVFLEALRQSSQVLGVIVGDGPQRDELARYVELQRIGNVRFLGAIPEADRVMPLFNVLCLPSLWEGLGLVLIEAMLRRVPVMGSRRGAIPEVLNHGRNGILFEPTVQGIVQGIDYAVKHPAVLRTTSDEAYSYAREQFTMEKMLQGTIAVYQAAEKRSKRLADEPCSALLQ